MIMMAVFHYCTYTEGVVETGGACHYTVSGINSKETIEFFRILRVAVVRLPAGGTSSSVQHTLPVIYRSFPPQLLPVTVEVTERVVPSDTFLRRRGSCQLVADLSATWTTSPQQVVVVEFGKRHDTTDTTDFCPRANLLRTCYGETGVMDCGLLNGLHEYSGEMWFSAVRWQWKLKVT